MLLNVVVMCHVQATENTISECVVSRYEQGEKDTGELGSFQAVNVETGIVDYVAHHYSEREIVYLLIEAGFEPDQFSYKTFTTRSGNKVNGAVIWAT